MSIVTCVTCQIFIWNGASFKFLKMSICKLVAMSNVSQVTTTHRNSPKRWDWRYEVIAGCCCHTDVTLTADSSLTNHDQWLADLLADLLHWLKALPGKLAACKSCKLSTGDVTGCHRMVTHKTGVFLHLELILYLLTDCTTQCRCLYFMSGNMLLV